MLVKNTSNGVKARLINRNCNFGYAKFSPKDRTHKKADQLAQKRSELNLAVQKNYKGVKLTKAVEKYRTAQISFLKAKMHVLREKAFIKMNMILKLINWKP